MPNPGSFVLNADSQFTLGTDGSWLLYDAQGQCNPCCGGGGAGDPRCTQNFPLSRTFTCPLNGQQTTLNARNDWADDFNWPQPDPWAFNQFYPPPCDNYVRFGIINGGSNGGASHAQLPANVLNAIGGIGRLSLNGIFPILLWNGGGPILETQMSVTFCRQLGNVNTWTRPNRMDVKVAVNSFFLGVQVPAITIGVYDFNWVIDGVNYGPSQFDDRLTWSGRFEWQHTNVATTKRMQIDISWAIQRGETGGTLSGSFSKNNVTTFWGLAGLPPCCWVQQDLNAHTTTVIRNGIFDDYSGSVINPVQIL